MQETGTVSAHVEVVDARADDSTTENGTQGMTAADDTDTSNSAPDGEAAAQNGSVNDADPSGCYDLVLLEDGWYVTCDGEIDEAAGILFVGDSRTAQLYHVMVDDGSTDISVYDTLDGCYGDLRMIARGGCDYIYSCAYSDEDYAWFEDDVMPRVETFIEENPTGTLLFALGFNDISYEIPACSEDMAYGAVQTAERYARIAEAYPDLHIVVMSLNPYLPNDSQLTAYNQYMETFADSYDNVLYLDTYSWLMDMGQSSVHYEYSVNQQLFSHITEALDTFMETY